MLDLRTIKSYITKKFEVELFQDAHGRYCIRYRVHNHDEYSEFITDYNTASYLFDLKLQELQGN